MGYRVDYDKMNDILAAWSEAYHVYAPAWDQRKKNVRYREIKTVDQIVLDRQADFSPKEAYYPVSQTMFYFTDTEVTESELADDKGIIVIARPCDINGMARLDCIFMENGGHADYFYARLREKVKVVMLECRESFEHCFCVSMGTNKTDQYDAALRITENEVLVDIKDETLGAAFASASACDFTPEYVQENQKKLHIPQITDRSMLKPISDLEYWTQNDEKCMSCGGCNTVCGTCSCFDTVDVIYQEGSRSGERRRVWSSCMLESYTMTAGGNRARKTPGANMRFKVLHKFYDFADRFAKDGAHGIACDAQMCVGCGRCDMRCPKQISFFDAVDGLAAEIEKMNAGEEA